MVGVCPPKDMMELKRTSYRSAILEQVQGSIEVTVYRGRQKQRVTGVLSGVSLSRAHLDPNALPAKNRVGKVALVQFGRHLCESRASGNRTLQSVARRCRSTFGCGKRRMDAKPSGKVYMESPPKTRFSPPFSRDQTRNLEITFSFITVSRVSTSPGSVWTPSILPIT